MNTNERINEFLSKFGKNDRGEPLFRLVWSEDQTEKRFGTYNAFSGKIFVRQLTGVYEVRKYVNVRERWVIEQWIDPSLCDWKELPESKEKGSYEPLYVFEGPNKEYLEPLLIVVQAIMHALIHPLEKGAMIAEFEKRELEQELAFEKAAQNMFDEESIMADKLKYGEAVSFANVGENKEVV